MFTVDISKPSISPPLREYHDNGIFGRLRQEAKESIETNALYDQYLIDYGNAFG